MERARALLAGFLLASCLAGAARAAGPELRVGVARDLADGVVEVPVEVRGGGAIGALHLELVFDPAALEAVSVEKGPAVPGDAMFDSNVGTPGRAIAGFAGMSPVAADGVLATVKLRRAGGARGEVPLVLEKVEAWAADDQRAIEVATTGGVLPGQGGKRFPLGLLAGAAALLLLLLLVVFLASRRRSSAPPAPRAGRSASHAPTAPISPSVPLVPASALQPDPTLLSAGPAVRFLTGSQFGIAVPLVARTRAGRDPDCEVVIDDPRISRFHFALEYGPSGWALSDQGSGNGTFVNGYRVTVPVLVGEGDEISAGDTRLRLEGLGAYPAPSVDPAASRGEEAPAFCSQCGQRLTGDARFCSRCGRPVA